MSDSKPYKTGLYWAKSRWNGFQALPIVLTITSTNVSAKTKDEILFDVPLVNSRAYFNSWSSLFITINNKKYRFVGYGAQVSAEYTKEQQEELRQADNTAAMKNFSTLAIATGNALRAVGNEVGSSNLAELGLAGQAAGSVASISKGLDNQSKMTELRNVFELLGVPTTYKKPALIRNVIFSVLLLFVVIIVLVSVASMFDKR